MSGITVRPSGQRSYKRIALISTEGSRTEVDYFSRFNSRYLHVVPLSHRNKTSPVQVLARLRAELSNFRLQAGDYAWMVIDRDDWPSSDIDKCEAWVQDLHEFPHLRKGMSLSNPKFEFWLLLHFEDGSRHQGARSCVDALKTYLPDYDKSLNRSDFSDDMVRQAISRARGLWGAEETTAWPRTPGRTNVFRLCEELRRVTEEEALKEQAAFA